MSFERYLLAVESFDLSQADKIIIGVKCLYASKEKIIFVLRVPSISQKLNTN